jgi:hypothetical protein
MSLVVVLCLLFGLPVFAVGFIDVQSTLERWDYQRHAED